MHRRQASYLLRKLKRAESVTAAFRRSTIIHDESSPSEDGRSYLKSQSCPPPEKRILLPSPVEEPYPDNTASGRNYSYTPRTVRDYKLQSDIEGLRGIIFGSYLNFLLFIGPVAIWAYAASWSPTWVFTLNFLTMVPLANILGEATEILALHTGETIGGLVNASFGNAVEVVIAIFALKEGQVRVVQSSLVGSILSNLLLVLGCCFLAGGMIKSESKFNAVGASANSSLLMLSALAMIIPTITPFMASSVAERLVQEEHILQISHIVAIFLFLMYIQLLIFQLRTHIHLFGDDEEDETANLSFSFSAGLLLAATLLVAMFSEFLVSSIDGFTEEMRVSKAFVGIIFLPIVGNAVEHVTAIKVALNDKMELAMGVAVGSATQVSLFVVPVVVLAGWVMGQPMTLSFPMFEVLVYLMSILIVYAIVADGKSNWLEGSMLLTAYIVIGVAVWWVKID